MKWTKVTPETLPPDGEAVLVTVENWKNKRRWVWPTAVKWEEYRFYAYMTDGFASGWESGCFAANKVTHWAPMPAPAENDDDAIDNAPTIDPSSLVKRGRWEPYDHDIYGSRQIDSRCSVCGHVEYTGGHPCTLTQCPNCFAMMED